MNHDEDVLLTLAEAAALAEVSVDTIRRRIADGTLPAIRIGRKPAVRIPRSAIAAVKTR